MTLRTGEDTLICKRRLWIALCGGTVLEEALDLSSDRLLNNNIISAIPNFTKLPLSDFHFFFFFFECRSKDKEILVVPPKSREQFKYDHVGSTCCTYDLHKMESAVTVAPCLN